MAASEENTTAEEKTVLTFTNDEDSEILIEILDPSSFPMETSRYMDHVRSSAAGAIATFEGTTRDMFEGKRVVELRYEAYVPMAVRQLRSIYSVAKSKWILVRLAVAHRLGLVAIGETSVFVAASAVHRADAMEACRCVIDEIKASIPIWKKEVYDNGEKLVRVIVLNDALKGMYNAEKRGKRQVMMITGLVR